jgi:hypothetical protein
VTRVRCDRSDIQEGGISSIYIIGGDGALYFYVEDAPQNGVGGEHSVCASCKVIWLVYFDGLGVHNKMFNYLHEPYSIRDISGIYFHMLNVIRDISPLQLLIKLNENL